MRRFVVITFLLLTVTFIANGQLWKARRLEYSAGLGTTQFYGDIGGFSNGKNILGIKDFTFRHTSIDVNTSLRYRITEDFAARLNLNGGYFHSTDIRGSNIDRGFQSTTSFLEPSLIGEFYIIKNKEENSFLFLIDKGQYLEIVFISA